MKKLSSRLGKTVELTGNIGVKGIDLLNAGLQTLNDNALDCVEIGAGAALTVWGIQNRSKLATLAGAGFLIYKSGDIIRLVKETEENFKEFSSIEDLDIFLDEIIEAEITG